MGVGFCKDKFVPQSMTNRLACPLQVAQSRAHSLHGLSLINRSHTQYNKTISSANDCPTGAPTPAPTPKPTPAAAATASALTTGVK